MKRESFYKRKMNKVQSAMRIENDTLSIVVVCFLTAIGIITVCSKSSPLYPFNDWVDANCFFTVGKSMMNGVVVYRDLIEQKGPFLYFIHGLAWLISKDTFLGVYLFEIVAAFFFLYYSFRIVRVISERAVIAWIPVMALLIYTTDAFCHGDSAEELCLPFLAYAAFVCVRALKQGEEIRLKEYFIVGVTSGCVFWTKFTMTGFYMGWFLVPAAILLYEKRYRRLSQVIGMIGAGVLVSTLPYVVYFGIHGAIGDWIDVYLMKNIFGYTMNADTKTGIINNILSGGFFMCKRNFPTALCGSIGMLTLLFKKERKIGVHLFFTWGATIFFTYMGGRFMPYYAFVFCVFLPYGIGVMSKLLHMAVPAVCKLIDGKVIRCVILCLAIIGAVILTPNRYLMGVDKGELPQYKFKEIINQVENPTLLNYGFLDGGFYTVCNIIPNCKAFCQLNNPITEMYALQAFYADYGLCDFIVTRNREMVFEKYTCVAKSSFEFEGILFDYYLYQKK